MGLGVPADNEKCRFDAVFLQSVEDVIGRAGNRSVIEGQDDLMISKLQGLRIGFEAKLQTAHRAHRQDAAGSQRIGRTSGGWIWQSESEKERGERPRPSNSSVTRGH